MTAVLASTVFRIEGGALAILGPPSISICPIAHLVENRETSQAFITRWQPCTVIDGRTDVTGTFARKLQFALAGLQYRGGSNVQLPSGRRRAIQQLASTRRRPRMRFLNAFWKNF